MSGKEYTLTCRVGIPACDANELLTRLEDTADTVWLSRTQQCDRYTLRGVPAKRIDVLISRQFTAMDEPEEWLVVDVGRKAGRFDGATRDRLTVRMMHPSQHKDSGRLSVDYLDNDRVRVAVTRHDGDVLWSVEYDVLRSDLTDYAPERIVTWQWTRYFRHLPWSEVEQAAHLWAVEEWPALRESGTLAEANRSASRMLYRLSRNHGWRKLTRSQRDRLGLTGQRQWYHETHPALLQQVSEPAKRTPSRPLSDSEIRVVPSL